MTSRVLAFLMVLSCCGGSDLVADDASAADDLADNEKGKDLSRKSGEYTPTLNPTCSFLGTWKPTRPFVRASLTVRLRMYEDLRFPKAFFSVHVQVDNQSPSVFSLLRKTHLHELLLCRGPLCQGRGAQLLLGPHLLGELNADLAVVQHGLERPCSKQTHMGRH